MIPERVEQSLDDLKTYCQSLGISPEDRQDDLLMTTFIHKSYAADFRDSANVPHNERLEFLWDSVLWCVIADFLYTDYPENAESKLTLSKIALVQEKTLAWAARDIALWEHIFLWKGEKKSWGADKNSVLSDWLEALIGYIYCVAWMDAASVFIRNVVYPYVEKAVVPLKSHKSAFQEKVQKHIKDIPTYEEEAIDVEPSWNVLLYRSTVSVQWVVIATGTGPSKKKAQEMAAKEAFLRYDTIQ